MAAGYCTGAGTGTAAHCCERRWRCQALPRGHKGQGLGQGPGGLGFGCWPVGLLAVGCWLRCALCAARCACAFELLRAALRPSPFGFGFGLRAGTYNFRGFGDAEAEGLEGTVRCACGYRLCQHQRPTARPTARAWGLNRGTLVCTRFCFRGHGALCDHPFRNHPFAKASRCSASHFMDVVLRSFPHAVLNPDNQND